MYRKVDKVTEKDASVNDNKKILFIKSWRLGFVWMFRDQTAGRRPREKTQEDKGARQRKNGSGSIVIVLVEVVLERTKWGRTRGSVRSAGLLPCIPGVVLVRARTRVAPWFHLSFAASLPRSASTLSSLA